MAIQLSLSADQAAILMPILQQLANKGAAGVASDTGSQLLPRQHLPRI